MSAQRAIKGQYAAAEDLPRPFNLPPEYILRRGTGPARRWL